MKSPRLAAGAIVVAAGVVAGCGSAAAPLTSAKPPSPTKPPSNAAPLANAADTTFLQDMIAHHMQAIAAGQLASTHATDPRVMAFGRRIVREQTPELQRMQAMVTTLRLTVSAAAGAQMAVNRITPAQLSTLASTTGISFDRTVIAESAMSELGAVQMAKVELADGSYGPARTIASSIASAGNPGSEIDQLKQLAAALPSSS